VIHPGCTNARSDPRRSAGTPPARCDASSSACGTPPTATGTGPADTRRATASPPSGCAPLAARLVVRRGTRCGDTSAPSTRPRRRPSRGHATWRTDPRRATAARSIANSPPGSRRFSSSSSHFADQISRDSAVRFVRRSIKVIPEDQIEPVGQHPRIEPVRRPRRLLLLDRDVIELRHHELVRPPHIAVRRRLEHPVVLRQRRLRVDRQPLVDQLRRRLRRQRPLQRPLDTTDSIRRAFVSTLDPDQPTQPPIPARHPTRDVVDQRRLAHTRRTVLDHVLLRRRRRISTRSFAVSTCHGVDTCPR
jgi:hypothetical protein